MKPCVFSDGYYCVTHRRDMKECFDDLWKTNESVLMELASLRNIIEEAATNSISRSDYFIGQALASGHIDMCTPKSELASIVHVALEVSKEFEEKKENKK